VWKEVSIVDALSLGAPQDRERFLDRVGTTSSCRSFHVLPDRHHRFGLPALRIDLPPSINRPFSCVSAPAYMQVSISPA